MTYSSLNDFWRVGSTKLTFVHLVLLQMTFPKNFIVGQRPTTSFPPAWVTCHGQLPMHTMTKQTNSSLFSFLDLRLSLNDPAVTDSVRIKFEKNHVFQYHFTARFCTSPFLSSSNFKSICTTFEGKREQYYRNYCPSLSALKKKGSKNRLNTDLPFTIIIQLNGVFLKFCHQIICCHKSEVLIAWCHLSRTIRE